VMERADALPQLACDTSQNIFSGRRSVAD